MLFTRSTFTNFVNSRVVGDSVAPLLRIVPLEGKHGDVVSKSFGNVHTKFKTIDIDIRDDTGRRVPFERYKVTVTLHVQRRKPSFFESQSLSHIGRLLRQTGW